MLSYTTSLDVGIFTMGIASATFTMKNFTNAFTPNAGGTYSSVNWFGSKFLLLLTLSDGTTSYIAYLFEGICTDFAIDSAYADSTVTFSCIDPFTYTGPTQTDYSVSTASLETAAYFIGNLVDKVKFPLLNYASASGAFNSIGVNDGTGTIFAGSSTKGGVSDIISSQLLPSSASISWPYYSSLNFIMTDITYNSAVIYLTPQKDKYEVQYAHYYFIPVYHSLCFWFEQMLTGGTECWSTRLMDFQTAENLAKSLKSIEDVRKWYERDEAKEKDFYKRKKEYYAKNVPYDTKYF